jgi:hypothetical protein
MLLRKYIHLLLLLPALLTLPGCTKHADGIPGAVGPAGPAGSDGAGIKPSAITGFVALYDQYGFQGSSNAGVVISTLNKDTPVTATTDSLGKFSLPPLPPGNYDLHFNKTGYDSLKVFVQHSGGDEPKFIGDVRLEEHVTTHITSETFGFTPLLFFNDTILLVNLTFNGPPSTFKTLHHFSFYFSHSKNVSSQNYDYMELGNNEATTTNTYQLQFIIENLTASGRVYLPGDTVYLKTFVSPVPQSATTWFDYTTYKAIAYPYLGDSLVNYFVWPH